MAFAVPENVEIALPPVGLEQEYFEIFTEDSIKFVAELASEFQIRIYKILRDRKIKKATLQNSDQLPSFSFSSKISLSINSNTSELFEGVNTMPGAYHQDWKISALPPRLQNRQLDLGDVAPSEDYLMIAALNSDVQGIQVDFDDGNCPTWSNIIKGIYNVVSVINGTFHPNKVPILEESPLVIMRPRAWNMNEHNFMVNGKEIPGPILDFGLLIYHIGVKTSEKGIGPFFYLPKLESANEARLWDDIFIWAENKLSLSPGTIKSCVLIENIFAAFEVEQILFELRHHSFGLNCGIWDYCASIINTFGIKEDFIFPDRSKYVNMDKPFLKNYMEMVIHICHTHGAPVTGGMTPFILSYIPENDTVKRTRLIQKVCDGKLKEIQMGVNGFLSYDPSFIPHLKNLWKQNETRELENMNFKITEKDLLTLPKGEVTLSPFQKNIKVLIMFIYSWIAEGKGHFVLEGSVEDSATAEISRSQIYQWIYHEVCLDDVEKGKITKDLVTRMTWSAYDEMIENGSFDTLPLRTSCELLLEIVTAYEPPEFITTYLYNHSTFRKDTDPCIEDLKAKYKINFDIHVIGLMVGSRGTIPNDFLELAKPLNFNKKILEDIAILAVKGSHRILQNHLYSPPHLTSHLPTNSTSS